MQINNTTEEIKMNLAKQTIDKINGFETLKISTLLDEIRPTVKVIIAGLSAGGLSMCDFTTNNIPQMYEEWKFTDGSRIKIVRIYCDYKHEKIKRHYAFMI